MEPQGGKAVTLNKVPFWRDDHTIRLSLLGLILTLTYLTILSPLGFLAGTRAASADALMRWRANFSLIPSEIKELTIITVDDESQRHLGQRWPWGRGVFADFLHKVSHYNPKAILFDFAFVGNGTPESDISLAQAIREAPPTLLASYLDSEDQLMLPEPQFIQSGGIPGLINIRTDRDSVVRHILAVNPLAAHFEPLYSIEVNAFALSKGFRPEKIRWGKSALMVGPHKIPIGKFGELRINYFVTLDSFRTLSFWKVLEDPIDPSYFQNKIVLVGSSREITHDVHNTPLGRMSGVGIEANSLLMLLTRRFLKELSLWAILPFGFIFTIGIVNLSYRASFPIGLLSVVLLIGFALVGSAFLILHDFRTEFVSPVILAVTAWFVGFFYKYIWLTIGALRLQHGAITDVLTKAYTSRYFHLRLEEEARRSRQQKRPIAVILVRVTSPSQMLHHYSWDEVQQRLKALLALIRTHSPAQAVVGRMQENCFGILLLDAPFDRAKRIAEKLHGQLRSLQEKSVLSFVSSDQSPLSSGDDLIRCAETALSRASQEGKASSLGIYDPHRDALAPPASGTSSPNEPASPLEYVASELEERNRSLEKALHELREVHQQLEAAFLEVTKSLVLALETKDAYTAGHLERVSRYSTRLAEVLQLPREEIDAIREAALLHDIGKIGLPDEVLHKVGALTEEEREIIKQHLMIGAKILEPMKFFKPLTTLIYHHHERYDGKGYPHGLQGDFIPAGAQVIAIADSFDAMTTNRGYNKPKSVQEATEELRRGSGTQFNPVYVEKFAELMQREGPHLAGYTAQ